MHPFIMSFQNEDFLNLPYLIIVWAIPDVFNLMSLVCPAPLFCLDFIEIVSLAKYLPSEWDMNINQTHGGGAEERQK